MNLDDQLSLFSETDKVEVRNVAQASVTESKHYVVHMPCTAAPSKMAEVIHLAHVRLVPKAVPVSDGDLLSRVLNRSRLF